MLINIRTSDANKVIVQDLTKRLNLGSENHISRIALTYSIAKGYHLNLESDIQDSKGKEYKEEVLFGRYRDFYVAMVCQHYNIYKTDANIPRYVKMHVDHGLELIKKLFESNKNYTSIDFLLDNIENGIDSLEDLAVSQEHVKNNNQQITKTHFKDLIRIQVGQQLDNGLPIIFEPNNLNR